METQRLNSLSTSGASDTELLTILAELAREVSSVLDLGDLLEKIPNLIAQLTQFSVFSVYLLDKERQELAIAYAVGYPEEIVKHFRSRSAGTWRAVENSDHRDRRCGFGSALPGGRCPAQSRSCRCRCATRER